jgi:gamma-glutamyltranspeptidase
MTTAKLSEAWAVSKVDRARAALDRMLEESNLMPSGKLPPERDLCEQIGVSRSTLRSALNLLEAEGKIWRRVGSGTYTGSTPPKELQGLPAISDATSPGELMELRLMIEPGIARLAALRATRSEIEYLKHCVAGADVRWPRLGTTVHVDIIDRQGNMVAATSSGAWIKSSKIIADLGFPLGNRLMTFYLAPKNHPNVVAPYKRPRTTLSPSLATVGARPWMAFGSMGGDQQDQWQLQFFLNRVVFGMTVQEAIEAPKFSSDHFPGFFAPHDRFPNKVRLETRMSSRRHAQRRRGAQAGDGKADGVQRHR